MTSPNSDKPNPPSTPRQGSASGAQAQLAPTVGEGADMSRSKEEQRKRFLARIDEPKKNWKFSLADIEERKFRKQYMKAFGECIAATSTQDSPWYVVPADDKENARLIVSQIVFDTLKGPRNELPQIERKARAGIAIDLQTAREMRTRSAPRCSRTPTFQYRFCRPIGSMSHPSAFTKARPYTDLRFGRFWMEPQM